MDPQGEPIHINTDLLASMTIQSTSFDTHLLASMKIQSTISPFFIDENYKSMPLNELPLSTNIPLRSCFLYLPCSYFSPPLELMEQGTSVMLLLSYSCVVEDRSIQLGDSMTPNFSLRYSKVSLGIGLVKISTTCSFVPIYSNLIFFNLFLKKVKLDWNVLCLGMHSWILGDTDSTRIVT